MFHNLFKSLAALYGYLPPEIPADIPEIDTCLIEEYQSIIWPLIPQPMRSEMQIISDGVGGRAKALFWNLHYELFGMGCVSAALPGKEGYLFHRRLEWDVGFTPEFRFRELKPGTMIRYTPGYVGALSGYTPHWHISMNAEPEMQDMNISDAVKGTPISWLLRSALAQGRSMQETQCWLMSKRAVRGAFVIMASRKEAVWMHIRGGGHENKILAHRHFPEPLSVGNHYEEREMDELGWAECGCRSYRAENAGDWVLDQYITPVG